MRMIDGAFASPARKMTLRISARRSTDASAGTKNCSIFQYPGLSAAYNSRANGRSAISRTSCGVKLEIASRTWVNIFAPFMSGLHYLCSRFRSGQAEHRLQIFAPVKSNTSPLHFHFGGEILQNRLRGRVKVQSRRDQQQPRRTARQV